VIEIRRLSRRFGSTRALAGIDLDIPTGETAVIFGHNGSGKTTLLKLVAGLLRPTSGEVLVDGRPPRAKRGRLGFLGHDLYLYPHLSALENLVLFARLYDVGAASAPGRADAALAAVGMTHKKDALVHTLSRGEGQRVALARAVVHDPDLLLVDEPFSGLDEASAAALPSLLKREGRTLVVATHDTERGKAIADRIVVLEQGRVTTP
jgi:ABC-type multidrug transport system ATPase subunit